MGFAPTDLIAQEWVIADVLGAVDPDGIPWHTKNAILAPRRSAKTAALFMVAIGRCLTRPGYKVVLTAQNGTKARERFLEDIVAPLETTWEPKAAPFKINHGQAGTANITFANGSKFMVLPPLEAAFRGNAADLVILDEAQEYEVKQSQGLLRGIMPTFATRTKRAKDGKLKVTAQLVLTGTAGEAKQGIFWDTLELGREGKAGIVEYAAPAGTRIWREGDAIEGTTADPEIWKLSHPGLDNLIPIEFLEGEAEGPQLDFAREWLCIWPDALDNTFLDPTRWARMAVEGPKPEQPKQFSLAAVAHRAQTWGAIAVCWYVDGKANVGLLAHRKGIRWLADEAASYALRFGVPIHYNVQEGASKIVADEYALMNPRPKTEPMLYAPKVAPAAELFVSEFQAGNIQHWNDLDLNAAIPLVRKYARPNQRMWSFTSDDGADITAVEAVALAMYAAKNTPTKKPIPRVTLTK